MKGCLIASSCVTIFWYSRLESVRVTWRCYVYLSSSNPLYVFVFGVWNNCISRSGDVWCRHLEPSLALTKFVSDVAHIYGISCSHFEMVMHCHLSCSNAHPIEYGQSSGGSTLGWLYIRLCSIETRNCHGIGADYIYKNEHHIAIMCRKPCWGPASRGWSSDRWMPILQAFVCSISARGVTQSIVRSNRINWSSKVAGT